MGEFSQKVAVVTGGAQGIGKAIAEEFCKEGASETRWTSPTWCCTSARTRRGSSRGENICIDGGMTKLMIYHNDYGWKLDED